MIAGIRGSHPELQRPQALRARARSCVEGVGRTELAPHLLRDGENATARARARSVWPRAACASTACPRRRLWAASRTSTSSPDLGFARVRIGRRERRIAAEHATARARAHEEPSPSAPSRRRRGGGRHARRLIAPRATRHRSRAPSAGARGSLERKSLRERARARCGSRPRPCSFKPCRTKTGVDQHCSRRSPERRSSRGIKCQRPHHPERARTYRNRRVCCGGEQRRAHLIMFPEWKARAWIVRRHVPNTLESARAARIGAFAGGAPENVVALRQRESMALKTGTPRNCSTAATETAAVADSIERSFDRLERPPRCRWRPCSTARGPECGESSVGYKQAYTRRHGHHSPGAIRSTPRRYGCPHLPPKERHVFDVETQ